MNFLKPNLFEKCISFFKEIKTSFAFFSLFLVLSLLTLPESSFSESFRAYWRSGFSTSIILRDLILSLFLFFMPGIAIYHIFFKQKRPEYELPLIVTISCAMGYLCFWFFFISNTVGQTVARYLAGFDVCFFIYLKWNHKTIVSHALKYICFLMLGVGLFYHTLLNSVFSTQLQGDQIQIAMNYHSRSLPSDSALPMWLADRLFKNEDPRNLADNWRSSDRPPLQAGLVLEQTPVLWKSFNSTYRYQSIAVTLQLLWVPAIWMLCQIFRVRKVTFIAVFLACRCSSFFFLNTVYVWPKLLAGAIEIMSFCLLLQWRKKNTQFTITLASILVALSLLSHGGSFFFFPALLIAFVWSIAGKSMVLIFKRCSIALLPFIILLGSWMSYQKFYDPPGDRLLKMHLACMPDVDSRTFFQTFKDCYREASLDQIWSNKLSNLLFLFGNRIPQIDEDLFLHLQTRDFFYLFWTFGLLNLGWLAFGWSNKNREASEVLRLSFLCIITSLIFWIVVLFGPKATSIHQGPYATFILCFVSLVVALERWPRLQQLVIVYQLIYFVLVNVLWAPGYSPLVKAGLQEFSFIVYLLASLGLMVYSISKLTKTTTTSDFFELNCS